jgi:iron complex outermembrane receptor protein
MKKEIVFASLFLLLTSWLAAQTVLTGKIINADNLQPLAGATIQVENSSKSAVADNAGLFTIPFDAPTSGVLLISHVGFSSARRNFSERDFSKTPEIGMMPESTMLDDIVISATRSRQTAIEYPARIDVLNQRRVAEIPALSADEVLRAIPGVSVSRGAAFLSSSTVSLRGMGSEQGRTLVLVDGVPINKSDGGSVNWNAVGVNDIGRVEVVKGPGSSIYGGNAMGGIINLITPVPEEGIHGNVSQSHGTFNTLQSKANITGKKENFFWGVNGMYRNSDGYITTPADDIDEYTVDSFLDEYLVNGRVGYLISPSQSIELAGGFYSGKRGTGSNYKGYGFENDDLASEEGAYNQYDGLNGRLIYRNAFSDNNQLNVTLFGQRENYRNIRESMRNDRITRYDVESIRTDMGLLSSYNFMIGTAHNITAGVDVKNGAVDGNDIYITSTDKVINKGKMLQTGIFVQDEIVLFNSPWRLLAGLRYDFANFYDGSFVVENPTKETEFLQDYAETLEDASFDALSPRLSLQYLSKDKFRVFGGYSRGFRPAVLDDMCRTGRISGGMKLANPLLKPEYLDNFEIGGDIFAGTLLTISPSVYYSIGTDYHAYIATGDSLILNNRTRPIRIKDNIGKVDILGAELAMNFRFTENLSMALAYSHIATEIKDYKRFNEQIDDDLVGKALVYQPKDIFHASVSWRNPVVNCYISYDYKGAQWLNDVNTEEIEAFGNIDLHLWREVFKGISASVKVHNLLDSDYVDSRNLLAPGRMITGEISYKF